MFLVYENKEVRVSKNIGCVLRGKYKKIVKPRNIVIYSSNISQNNTAYILRRIIKSKVVFYPNCILGKFLHFYFSKNRKGIIFVANQKQIERIVDIMGGNYEIIANKRIISINL